MIHTDEKRKIKADARRRPMRWLAVVAVILVVGIGVLLVAREGEVAEPPGEIEPAATAEQPDEVEQGEAADTAEPTDTTVVAIPTEEGFWESAFFSLVLGEGDYAVVIGDFVVDAGEYAVDADVLTLTSDESSAACAPGAVGTYGIAVSGGQLELEPIDDQCGFDRGFGVGAKTMSQTDEFDLPPAASDVALPLGSGPAPGLFEVSIFTPGFEFLVPPRWELRAETEDHVSIVKTASIVIFQDTVADTIDEVVSQFEQQVISVGDPSEISIGGAEGVMFDFEAEGRIDVFNAPGVGFIGAPPESAWRAYVVDLGGDTITIGVSSMSQETFEAGIGEIERILESVRWDNQ